MTFPGVDGQMKAVLARPKGKKKLGCVVVIHDNRGLTSHIIDIVQNYLKSLAYLRSRKDSNGKTGCIGFCWGGGMSNKLAVMDQKLNAAIAYNGAQAKAEDVSKIRASVMLHYGGLDERINAGILAYEQALKQNHIDYKVFVYDGVNHALNNNTSPTRYNEAAAKLAWQRTIDLFKEKLG